MRTHGTIPIPSTLVEFAHPARCALLIYDMQAGIARQVPGAAAIVEQLVPLIAGVRAAGMRIAYCRHLSLPRAWMGGSQMRTAMAWQRTDDAAAVQPWFLRGSDAIEIVPELQPHPDDMVFDKIAMSAFEGTFLGTALRDVGVTSIALAGIALEIGIEPTVRHATDLGLVPIVLTDVCGAGNAAAGARALETLRFTGEAVLTTSDAFLAASRGTAS